ncbi:MAG TPA: GxxExxY protein [Polyangiaceae bacterium]|nr:GxxExxY protein [Polyangiaceae bacterium]
MDQKRERSEGFEDCSHDVIGACIEVHRVLGPGLLESAYEACLAHEFALRDLSFERQKPLPVRYKGLPLECGYRMDFVMKGELVLEVKAVEHLLPIHSAQLISYLRLTGIRTGLLVNFHAETIQRGLRRLELPPTPSNLPSSC